jgi:hypothetical protein
MSLMLWRQLTTDTPRPKKEPIMVQVEIDVGVVESMLLKPISDRAYRVEEQPILCDKFVIFDAIEGDLDDENVLRNVKVVAKSGWRSFQFAATRETWASGLMKKIAEKVEAEGGLSEQVMGGLFFVSMPPNSTYDPTEDVIQGGGS